jgi:hypothetical protein
MFLLCMIWFDLLFFIFHFFRVFIFHYHTSFSYSFHECECLESSVWMNLMQCRIDSRVGFLVMLIYQLRLRVFVGCLR